MIIKETRPSDSENLIDWAMNPGIPLNEKKVSEKLTTKGEQGAVSFSALEVNNDLTVKVTMNLKYRKSANRAY